MGATATNPLYAISDIPGKGKGLLATQPIPKGTRILSETPLLTVGPRIADRTQLELRVVNVQTGNDRALTTFTPTPLFVGQFLPFFDQYALSHSVWAPDSSAVVLPMFGSSGPQIVVVPLEGESTVLGSGEMPFWSRR